jgi:hypothetical protein
VVGVGWSSTLSSEPPHALSVASAAITNDVENERLMIREYKEFGLFLIFFISNTYFSYFCVSRGAVSMIVPTTNYT